MENKSIKDLFNELRDSDWLMFYHTKWYYFFSKAIFFITRKKIDHVGVVFNVRREDKLVVFDFYEYKATENCIKSTYAIFKDEYDNYYLKGFTADKIYYSKYNQYPSIDCLKKGKYYADKEAKNNSKYSFSNLALSLDFVWGIIPKKLRANPFKSKLFCSQFAYLCDYATGKLTKEVFRKDKWVSPAELMDLNYRTFYTILDYKK